MSCTYSVVFCAVLFVVVATGQGYEAPGSVANLPTAMNAGTPGFSSGSASGAAKANERLREGTKLVDVVGTFQSAGGDSITFSREGGKESFRVLENLALQRVGQALENNLNAKQWIISGEITEYRGANYLLLKKTIQPLQEGESGPKQ